MKKSIKSIISLSAVLILIFTGLTACRNNEPAQADEAVSGASVQQKTVSQESSPKAEDITEKNTSESATVNPAEWKSAYKKILTAPAEDSEFVPQGFALVRLDGDDIPELIALGGGSHMDTVKVYTFYNGKVTDCGESGSFGAIGYSGNRIIGVLTSGAGVDTQQITVDEVNEGKHKVVWYGRQLCEMGGTPEFYSGEKKVSLEEFQKRYNEFVPDSISFVGYGIGPAVDVFSEAFGCKTVKCTDKSETFYQLSDEGIIDKILGD